MIQVNRLLLFCFCFFLAHAVQGQEIVPGAIWPERLFHLYGRPLAPETSVGSRYIWLPIQYEDGLPVLRWQDRWTIGD